MASSGSELLEEVSMNFFVELISNNTYDYCFSYCIGRLDLKEQLLTTEFQFLIYFMVSTDLYICIIKMTTLKH
jgi:hypothetical protein